MRLGKHLIPALLGCLVSAQAIAGADEISPDALRSGGLVIALLTGGGNRGVSWPQPPPDCAPGARLSEAGWREARAIGTGLRKQGVQVEVAHAGPGCAARHTAYLVFGADRVRHDPGLAASCNADEATRRERRAALLRRLSTVPPYTRMHLAVIVDACNLHDLAHPDGSGCAVAAGPGDAVLFEPQAGRPPKIVGCLQRDTLLEWSRVPDF